MDREPIGVIGVGWVGLVTAAGFAELGHEVYARDIVEEKVEALRRGEVPIHEPGLPELLERNRERIHFTTDMGVVCANAQLLFCCVDTPPTYSGDADLSRVERVVDELGESSGHALVMKSTVPVGTGRWIQRRPRDVGYVSCPEFLKEGAAVADFMEPDRLVVGAGPESAEFGDRVERLYEPLGAPIVRTDVASAEMIKLASNAFLATKISFINEIANVSEELGADVEEVARGMGLDERIGPHFLRAGIGYGGSCLAAEETVLVRQGDRAWTLPIGELFDQLSEASADAGAEANVVFPDDLEILAWRRGAETAEFLPAAAVTRRRFAGELVEVRTEMGRRVRVTPDHPFVVAGADGGELSVKRAEELEATDWLPVAQGSPAGEESPARVPTYGGALFGDVSREKVVVRPAESELASLAAQPLGWRRDALDHPSGSVARIHAIVRSGALNLAEARRLGVSLEGAALATARNGAYLPSELELDAAFWRVVGLYIAEGHCSVDGRRRRLQWSFHPTDEQVLVAEVAGFWARLGVARSVRRTATTTSVSVSSRLLADFWIETLGLGRNCYEQRIPNAIWLASAAHKRALLAGMWLGDGSWSYVSGGPSVVLEYGTASGELADGTLRLLGDLGIVARLRVGRTAKSTCDTYWITISGADQIERAAYLVAEPARAELLASLARQTKRTAPTGYRRHDENAAWVRVAGTGRRPFDGHVYSVEVPRAHTFVTTGGLVTHNCFPKDVSALKQLAGNSGYHFQLLSSVIEVNELQKRRTIGKLQKHLGSLVGKEIALLGVAFKPHTDDVREATALVLAHRLIGEGAEVRIYDPVAMDNARDLLGGARMCDSAEDALDGADAAVLVTEWPEFRELDWAGEIKRRMRKALVVDGRNFLDDEALRAAGYTYEGIGRPSVSVVEA
jgi:UDPglucose 6-dehydrogenase